MTDKTKSITWKSIVAFLITILLSLVSLTYWDVRGDVTELKHVKADKELVMFQYNSILRELGDMKEMIGDLKHRRR